MAGIKRQNAKRLIDGFLVAAAEIVDLGDVGADVERERVEELCAPDFSFSASVKCPLASKIETVSGGCALASLGLAAMAAR